MKKIILILIVLYSNFANGQNYFWVNHITGADNQLPNGNRMSTNRNGDSYIIGTFNTQTIIGTTTLTSNGTEAVFIAKYDSQGINLWAKKITGTIRVHGNALTTDSKNNVYVTGMFEGNATFQSTTLTSTTGYMQDLYIAKYDSSGNMIWVNQYSGSDIIMPLSIKGDTLSNIYLTGTFSGSRTFGTTVITSIGVTDMFLIKLDSSGAILWAKNYGGNSKINPYDITLDNNLNIYSIGHFGDPFNGAPIQYIIIGTDSLVTPQSKASEIYLAKFNNQGTALFGKKMGGDYQNDKGLGIDYDGNAHIYITGGFEGQSSFGGNLIYADPPTQYSYSIFLAKYDLQGNCNWVTKPDSNISNQGMDVRVVDTSNIYIGGGVRNISISKFNNSGANMWTKTIGYSTDNGISITNDSIGSIYLTATFSDSLKTNIDTLITSNLYDNFICKLDSGILSGIADYSTVREKELLLFPNPASDFLTFIINSNRLDDEFQITTMNILGKTFQIEPIKSDVRSINIQSLNQGIYFLQIQSKQKVWTGKFIKE